MKPFFKFVLLYHAIFYLIWVIAYISIETFSAEIFAYMLWFNISYLILNTAVYIAILQATRRARLRGTAIVILSFLIFFTTMNILPYIVGNSQVIIVGVIEHFMGKGYRFLHVNNIGLLGISILSFTIVYALYRRSLCVI